MKEEWGGSGGDVDEGGVVGGGMGVDGADPGVDGAFRGVHGEEGVAASSVAGEN